MQPPVVSGYLYLVWCDFFHHHKGQPVRDATNIMNIFNTQIVIFILFILHKKWITFNIK